jgi:hypothetical protein
MENPVSSNYRYNLMPFCYDYNEKESKPKKSEMELAASPEKSLARKPSNSSNKGGQCDAYLYYG